MPSWILAIDFGTSYTVAAARVDDRAPEIVEIAGERRMPSVVMVDSSGDVFVGRTAEDLSVTHPGSTLRALKNRLGDQTPVILGGRAHQVVTLVAALLHEVYDQVVVQMGEPPMAVRLTHPATWNRPRVNRLIEAAAKAGLPNPLLVPEPVAAALSYAADVGLEPGRPIVVYDLGGGTFDSAVVTARDGGFAVIGRPGGDQHIGGELFDELIVNHVGQMLDAKVWEAIQVGDDALWRQVGAALRNEVRKAKEALSSHPYVNLLVPLPAGLWQLRFIRDEFHTLVRPYIAETITTLQRCVAEAGVRPAELAGISLVGGSSRMPLVEEMVQEAFPTVVISRRGDPKATVAAGATLAESPTASAPGLWRSPVTREAAPGTAQQRIRLAPPPISQPPDAPRSPSQPSGPPQRPSERPPDPQPSQPSTPLPSPPAGPVASPPVLPAGAAADQVPAGPRPADRPSVEPPAQPPRPLAPPVPKPPQPATVAFPTERPPPQQPPRPGQRSRRTPAVIVSVVVVMAAAIAGVLVATRSGDDTSTADSSQPTSQVTAESIEPSASSAAPTTDSAATESTATESTATTTESPATTMASTVTDYGGAEVSIRGNATGDPPDAVNAVLQAFGESNGINISFEAVGDLYGDIDTQVQSGDPPDIAFFPEPRKLIDLVRTGSIKPLADSVTASIAAHWSPDYADTATVDGVQYGVPVNTVLKSLVWYQPRRFEEAGYQVPTTFGEFTALIDQVAADGGPKALCVGLESGANSGWVFTDWVEEMVLRQAGGDVYDQWVAHEIPFNDLRIVTAMQTVLDLWAEENVFARDGGIAATSFADTQALVDGDCLMNRQFSYFNFSFPDGTAFADGSADAVDVFYLPDINGDKPVLTQSYYAAAFNDDPATMAVLEYMATADYAQKRQAEQTRLNGGSFAGFLSAAIGQETTGYQPLERGFLEILNNSQLARWDASELMPPEIGAGAFQSLGISAVRGEITAQEAADQIEAAWAGG